MTDSELQVNRSPLEQRLKSLLSEAKQTPDPSLPYSLQLTLWGLENLDLIGPWKSSRSDLEQQAELMRGLKPQLVHRTLTRDLNEQKLRKADPQQAATFLIENLYDVLQSKK